VFVVVLLRQQVVTYVTVSSLPSRVQFQDPQIPHVESLIAWLRKILQSIQPVS